MKVGNSLVLVLPRPLCDVYQIQKGETFDILATDDGMFIPAKPLELNSLKETMEKYVKEKSK